MKTEIVHEITIEKLQQAAELIRQGGLVVFPTETVYGLGASALDATAASKIYTAKGRPQDNPLIIHVAQVEDAEKYCTTNALFYRLAERFMPGPLTVILPKKECIPMEVTGGLDTVAVRCPSNPIAHTLIALAEVPIAAPSANLSGRPSPTTVKHVMDDLNGRVDMILDGGDCVIGVESTVVRVEEDRIFLLRPGAVTEEELETIAPVTVDKVVIEKVTGDYRPLSPGMKYRHYAPKAPVVLLEGNSVDILFYLKSHQKIENCGILCYDEQSTQLEQKDVYTIGKEHDSAEQAHRLFACLRAFDETDVTVIYAPLPHKEGIGLAVFNRLAKASGFQIVHVEK